MKLKIAIALLLSNCADAMEEPPQVFKRPAPEVEQELRVQPKVQRGEAEIVAYPKSSLGALPEELQKHIFDYLVTARGATNQKKLFNAAENIRNFLTLSKQFKAGLYDKDLAGKIIKELAKRYTHNNLVLAAEALATDAASRWLADTMKESLKVPSPAGAQFMQDLDHALFVAVDEHELGVMRFLLHYQPERVDYAFSGNRQNLLVAAIKKNDRDMIKLLLKFDANPDNDAMEKAAETDLEILKDLVAAGGNINHLDSNGSSLLFLQGTPISLCI